MSEPEFEPAPPSPTRRWYQCSLQAIFVVMTMVAILLAAAQTLGSRLHVLLVGWVLAILLLLAIGPKAGDPPRVL